MSLPSYPRVLTLGAMGTEQALTGRVVVQEKVDGSMFRFGIINGEFVMGSHRAMIEPSAPEKMFSKAVETAQRIKPLIEKADNLVFYCEYLQKPKHNTLAYETTPEGHLVLFDVLSENVWQSKAICETWAEVLHIDMIPCLHIGEITLDGLQELLTTPSYLGKETIEGVVIKNYQQTWAHGGRIVPLFTKLVRPEFKERHAKDWKGRSRKSSLEDFIESFCAEARWVKAVQHLGEAGQLQHAPQDIGPLIQEIAADIEVEDGDEIKETLYKLFLPQILRAARKGFPEWYKARLADWLRLEDVNDE